MPNSHQLQEQNKALAILNDIAQYLNKEVSLEKALSNTLPKVVQLLDLRTAWIWLVHEKSKQAYLAASYNLPPIFLQEAHLLTGTCYCLEKYLHNHLDNVGNISEITCTRLKNLDKGTEGLRYHASIPLSTSNGKIGIMNVVSPNLQRLSKDKIQLLHTIGDMLSIAITRARLFENSQQMGVMKERNRLSREIHDTLAQGLVAISLKLEVLSAFLESRDNTKDLIHFAKQINQLTKANIQEARRSVLDLRAMPLEKHNLVEALAQLLAEQKNTPNSLPPQTHFKIIGQYQKQAINIETSLYRITQEILNNARQHSEAKNIFLTLNYSLKNILLSIKDDGKGFDTQTLSNLPKERHFGLIGINERVELLKGTLKIESTINIGTEISINIPI